MADSTHRPQDKAQSAHLEASIQTSQTAHKARHNLHTWKLLYTLYTQPTRPGTICTSRSFHTHITDSSKCQARSAYLEASIHTSQTAHKSRHNLHTWKLFETGRGP